MVLAHRYTTSNINKKISLKGRDEQELQFLFPSLYTRKAVTRNTIGIFNQFDRRHYGRAKTYIPFL